MSDPSERYFMARIKVCDACGHEEFLQGSSWGQLRCSSTRNSLALKKSAYAREILTVSSSSGN